MKTKKKVKIIFAVTNDIVNDRRMQRISSTLVENNFEVLLVGRKLKKNYENIHHIFQIERLNCFFRKGFFFYAEYNIRLFFYILFSRCQIISSVDTDTLTACGLAAIIKRKKLVYDAHEYFTEVPEVTNRKIVKYFWKIIENIFIGFTKKCYTVSNSIAEIYSKEFHKKFEVIYNVPQFGNPQFTIHHSSLKTICYQGATNEGRGLEELIYAMKDINATLKIAGDGDKFSELKKLVAELNLEDKIIFLGMLKPDELAKFTNEAYIGYNVLQNIGLSYYYSLSNKFFDYIHAGIPSLSSNFPEYVKINVKYNVTLLTDCNAESVKKNLQLLLNDEKLYNEMKKNCSLAAEEFQWKNEEKKLLNIYEQLR